MPPLCQILNTLLLTTIFVRDQLTIGGKVLALNLVTHLRRKERHLPYGITHYYLPPDSPTQTNAPLPTLTPAMQADQYSINLPRRVRRDGELS